ncbi:hypothetical protein GIB67_022425 [Kingdonia uniflora]|uniref:Late embryogenesis abundant protein LEA-2 subgroup domain-containing protein n=1 Tax=Kingdonia uniflora TaxID=39325 RepID=A0A7J7MTW4_9MAGN|nr:hypothetical protein GIB67_022425 [Kingdonia uniflora]
MSSHTAIPIQPVSGNRPIKRHHTASYYVHRVQESLTSRVFKIICAVFLNLVLLLGIIAFIVWLSLRPHRPRFYISSFSIPSLNQENGFENAQISFDETVRNANHDIGIYYDAMTATVYYRDKSIGETPLLYPFYQPSKNTTLIHGELSGATLTVNSDKWKEFLEDRRKGTVIFRLDISSRIRFKVKRWNSRHHKMHTSCDVRMGSDGVILPTWKDKRCPVYFS